MCPSPLRMRVRRNGLRVLAIFSIVVVVVVAVVVVVRMVMFLCGMCIHMNIFKQVH